MKSFQLNCKGKLYSFHDAFILGIVNVTPDSFYDGGKNNNSNAFKAHIDKLVTEGADGIDIGGYSTRPNAKDVSEEEELSRVVDAIQYTKEKHPDVLISIDTFRASIAEKAIASGAHIINDIAGGRLDKEMFPLVKALNVPYVLMHSRGTPKTMQSLCHYKDVTKEVLQELAPKVEELQQAGVSDIILDPGFGFAKTMEQNYALLKNLNVFSTFFQLPLMVGISRKSMIHKALNISPEESLNGTTALNTIALQQNAQLLRVHDVKEAKQLVQLLKNLV